LAFIWASPLHSKVVVKFFCIYAVSKDAKCFCDWLLVNAGLVLNFSRALEILSIFFLQHIVA
jgi:hypothetical protein